MKPNTPVKVEIGLNGNRLNIDLSFADYRKLHDQIMAKESGWLNFDLSKGAIVELKVESIQFIKMRPSGVKELSKLEGYTLKDICSVTGVNYDVYRQQIKKEGIELDYSKGKRILLTHRTIKELKLTSDQIKKIESKFGDK